MWKKYFIFILCITCILYCSGCQYIDFGDGHRILPWRANQLFDDAIENYEQQEYTNDYHFQYASIDQLITISDNNSQKEIHEYKEDFIKRFKDGVLTIENNTTKEITTENYIFEDYPYLYMVSDVFAIVDHIMAKENLNKYLRVNHAQKIPYEQILLIDVNHEKLIEDQIIETNETIILKIRFNYNGDLISYNFEIDSPNSHIYFQLGLNDDDNNS